jgi:DNA-binding CsgD family transcriptional regulator
LSLTVYHSLLEPAIEGPALDCECGAEATTPDGACIRVLSAARETNRRANVLLLEITLPHQSPPALTPVLQAAKESRLGEPENSLTPHEIRLVKLLVEGHGYKTAAAVLGVTSHTVSFHLRRVYQKLDVHSKSEAVGKALRRGLV